MYDDARLMDMRENFLIDNRPEFYRELLAEGTLEEHLERKAKRCLERAESIAASGITFKEQAMQWAIREVLLETEWD